MKIKFDLECTPEEARAFLGLPNVAPLQDKMMQEVEEKMQENIRNLDPESFVKTWMPATIQGWTDLQQRFWQQMGMAGARPESSAAEPEDKA